MAACRYCSAEYIPAKNAEIGGLKNYCSRLCKKKQHHLDKLKYVRRIQAERKLIEKQANCRRCAKVINYYHPKPAFCSPECRTPPTKLKERKQRIQKHCTICGAAFMSLKREQCSNRCYSKTESGKKTIAARLLINRAKNNIEPSRVRERVLKYGLVYKRIKPSAVLDRDNWTCQICGAHLSSELRGTYDDRAPEVDHIIPLSLGGTHTLDNLQCACRRCNIIKGNDVKV